MQISVIAPAKLNLSLDILGKNDNGYHEIITLFQAIDLQDKLSFKFSQSKQDETVLSLNPRGAQPTLFPLDASNLISRAIKLFLAQCGDRSFLKIEVEIEKNIPIGAGLAGGSTNAAAALIALNQYFGVRYTDTILGVLAAQLGSDVAFCLQGGLAIGRGRGEKLEKLDLNLNQYFVLVKPRAIAISTPWAYTAFDQANGASYIKLAQAEAKLKNLITEIEYQRTPFWNCFEPVIYGRYPILTPIKKYLLDLGCLDVHLTGSGPTIYGLVNDKEQGNEVLKNILATDFSPCSRKSMSKDQQKEIILEGWLARTIGHGVQVLDPELSSRTLRDASGSQ